MTTDRWQDYLADFHDRQPGITEQILTAARAPDGDAYDWLAAAVSPTGRLLDLACGNGALQPKLPGRFYLGLDASDAELAAARARGVTHLAQARAAALPLPDSGFDIVTSSMALQILTPLPAVLAEISRVLRRGGQLIATMPATGPLRPGDLPALAGLLAALGRALAYPNDPALRQLPQLLGEAGLRLIADETRRYTYRLASAADADLLLASLYLPDLPQRRRRAARAWLRALARLRIMMPVPIRRIRAVRI